MINKELKYLGKDGSCEGNGKIEMCSVELCTGQDNRAEGMEKFIEQFEGEPLVARDFNGHHHLLGNLENCTVSNNLFHCIT